MPSRRGCMRRIPRLDSCRPPGKLVAFRIPADVRLDTGFETGGVVTPYYDAMIAKVIAYGEDRRRDRAARRRA